MPSYPVKNFSSNSSASNVVSGTAQSLQSMLRACLSTGYGSKAVQSLVISAGVATLTFATAHAYPVGSILRVAGGALAAVNGEQLLLSTSTTTVTYAVPGAPDGAVTGSITTDFAPLGWTESFVSGGLSVFKPSAVEATGMLLRVDDTGTTNARLRAFESMTDVDTGVGLIPLESQVSGGLFWPKSGAGGAVARPWFLIGDARGFYFAIDPQGTGRYTLMYFGDIASLKSGDAYGAVICGNEADQTAATSPPAGCCGFSHRSARGGAYLARAHTGIGQSVAARRVGSHHNGPASDLYAGTTDYGWGSYPNGANNGLMTGQLELVAAGSVRGVLPGLVHPWQDCSSVFASGAIVDGTDDFLGHKLMALRVAPPSSSASPGTVFIDLTSWSR